MTEHPTETTLSAFIDGRLEPVERARVAAHLDLCESCRYEVRLAAGVLLDGEATTRRRGWLLPGAAAAAVIAALLLLPPDPGPVERSGRPEGTPTFEIVAPEDGLRAATPPAIFVWRAAAAEGTYVLTLTDERGDVVWSAQTTDTVLALPADLDLPGGIYFWMVDALLERGREAATGVHQFTVGE